MGESCAHPDQKNQTGRRGGVVVSVVIIISGEGVDSSDLSLSVKQRALPAGLKTCHVTLV